MGMTLFAFDWFTHNHGLLSFGFIMGFAVASIFYLWERVGWSFLFSFLGATLLALAAHFLHWWR